MDIKQLSHNFVQYNINSSYVYFYEHGHILLASTVSVVPPEACILHLDSSVSKQTTSSLVLRHVAIIIETNGRELCMASYNHS